MIIGECLKTLSHEDWPEEAQRGFTAGKAWAESRPLAAVKAVLEFAAVSFSDVKVADGALWDGDHDAAFDHYHERMYEAVGDDADFDDAVTEHDWGEPFQVGWFLGVAEAAAPLAPAPKWR